MRRGGGGDDLEFQGRAAVAERVDREAPLTRGGPAVARLTLRLPPLFPYQEALVLHPARDLVVVSATQIGKSTACAAWLLARAWMRSNSRCWWVAPTYFQSENGYGIIKQMCESAGVLSFAHAGKLRIGIINGSIFECRSWERDENLQGPSIHAGVVDEAGLLTPSARGIISSRRSATFGPLRYIGNPTVNMSEFWRLCRQAAATDNGGDLAFLRWTWEDKARALGPAQAKAYRQFIEDERRNLPADEFRRLYEAAFLELGAGIIDLSKVCVNGGSEARPVGLPFEEPWAQDGEEEERCYGGLDLGQKEDFTVLSVFGSKSGRLKTMIRFKGEPWEIQVDRVVRQAERYGRSKAEDGRPARPVLVYFDETGVGGPVAETLQRRSVGSPVRFHGVTFNSDNKQTMVQALQLAIEQKRISMPYIAEAVSECETLERTVLATSVRYRAAEGFHDDVVWSLGLAMHAILDTVIGVPV
jgi:hypothetical protein